MQSSFSPSYSGNTGRVNLLKEDPEADFSSSKMKIAREVVANMIKNNLRDDDNIGIVLFDDSASVALPMTSVCELNIDKLVENILTIESRGGTNFEIGYSKGAAMLKDFEGESAAGSHNRIVFLTDAQPNVGDTSETGLVGLVQAAAKKSIFSTFIGIGLDFNTDLVEHFAKVKGCNYFSTMSSSQMAKTLDQEFDFFVSPMVFDLELKVQSESDMYSIAKVYGSPQADQATGRVLFIETLFPSAKTAEGVKGGVVLVQLKPNFAADPAEADFNKIVLTTTFKDADGTVGAVKTELVLPQAKKLVQLARKEYFDNSGTRKAVFLSRYANVLKNWLADQRKIKARTRLVSKGKAALAKKKGLWKIPLLCSVREPIPIPVPWEGSRWERQPEKLKVHKRYQRVFKKLLKYAENEFKNLQDETLQQEFDVLSLLASPRDHGIAPLRATESHPASSSSPAAPPASAVSPTAPPVLLTAVATTVSPP